MKNIFLKTNEEILLNEIAKQLRIANLLKLNEISFNKTIHITSEIKSLEDIAKELSQ